MAKQLRCAAWWMRGVAETLAKGGLTPADIFAEAGFTLDALNDPESRISVDGLGRIWEVAVLRSGNPAIALCGAFDGRPVNFDIVGYAMMAAPDLLGSLRRLIRFSRLITDASTLVLREDSDGWRLVLHLHGGRLAVARQRYEFGFVTFLQFCRWIAGKTFTPVALEFAFPEPADLTPYQEAFQCELRFDRAMNALLFDAAALTRPLHTAQGVAAEAIERVAEERLMRLDDRVSYRVRQLILARLPDGEPLRFEVAAAMGLTDRRLQRLLQIEETSFRRLLDEARRDRARHFLRTQELPLAQIAYMLGMADMSSFFRACKRWFGCSPILYRQGND